MEKLLLKKKADGWWILDPNNIDVPEYGPYDTKKEAEHCAASVSRTWEEHYRLIAKEKTTYDKEFFAALKKKPFIIFHPKLIDMRPIKIVKS